MNLYIKIDANNNPINYPTTEQNVLEHLGVDALTPEILKEAGFVKFERRIAGEGSLVEEDEGFVLEADGIVRPKGKVRELTYDEKTERLIKNPRSFFLRATDWTDLPSAPLSDEERSKWQIFRQELRDLPSKYPELEMNTIIDWPEAPSTLGGTFIMPPKPVLIEANTSSTVE